MIRRKIFAKAFGIEPSILNTAEISKEGLNVLMTILKRKKINKEDVIAMLENCKFKNLEEFKKMYYNESK